MTDVMQVTLFDDDPGRICSVEGCSTPSRRRGWCHRHYNRWYKYGDPLAPLKPRSDLVDPTERTCRTCGVTKPGDEFSWTRHGKPRRDCKRCSSAKSIVWRDANREKVLNAHFLRTYGITLDEYNKLLAEQGGVCAICGRGPEVSPTKRGQGRSGRLVVDHCHETGRIRGLLCTWCNKALGNLEDDPARFRAALRYLEGG